MRVVSLLAALLRNELMSLLLRTIPISLQVYKCASTSVKSSTLVLAMTTSTVAELRYCDTAYLVADYALLMTTSNSKLR